MKTILSTLLMLSNSIYLSAQSGFQKIHPFAMGNSFYDFHVCSNDDILVAGRVNSTDYIQKMDVSGNILWTYQLSIPSSSQFLISEIGEFGNSEYYVSGSLGAPDNSIFLIKLNNSGTVLWSKEYDPGNLTYFYKQVRLNIIPPNNIVISIEDPHHRVLIKTDFNGNLIWDKKIWNDTAAFAVNTSVCSVILPGNEIVNIGYTHYQLTVVKIHPSGPVLWSKTYETGLNNGFVPQSAIITSDANILITGVNDGHPSLMKMDTQGTVLWQNSCTCICASILDVKELPDGNLAIAASDAQNSTAIMVADGAGNTIRISKVVSMPQSVNYFNSVSLTSNNEIVFGGAQFSNSNGVADYIFKMDTTFTGACSLLPVSLSLTDTAYSATIDTSYTESSGCTVGNLAVTLSAYSLLWLDYCTALGIENENEAAGEEAIQLSPVPVSQGNDLNISLGKINSDLRIVIYSVDGKIVYENTCHRAEQTFRLSTAPFSKGMYVMRISGNGVDFNKKFIIQ